MAPGRIPKPTSSISPRFIWLGAALGVILLFAIIYGFKVRFEKQRERKAQQYVQISAPDAAQSNRKQVEAERDFPAATPPATGQANLGTVQSAAREAAQPVIDAARTVAHPFPDGQAAPYPATAQPQQTYFPPVYPMSTTPAVNPELERRKQAIQQQEERLKAAILASTGVQPEKQAQQTQQSTSSGDPLRDEIDRMNALLSKPTGTGIPVGGSNPIRMPNLDGDSSYNTQNAQEDKRKFQGSNTGAQEDYLRTARVPALSPWVVQRGTVIPAKLPNKIVSDLPGDVIAEVDRDVFDSPTQKFVMIPAGSRLVGEYNSSVAYGQNRVQVAWIAIYFPDGSHIDIDRMPSHDAEGATGLKDQTDNHWKRVIGGVALSSMLAAGLQISQNRTNGSVLQYPSNAQVAGSAIGMQASQLGQQVTNRNLNVQPTLKIRPGEIFAVSVTKDMIFEAPYMPIGGGR